MSHDDVISTRKITFVLYLSEPADGGGEKVNALGRWNQAEGGGMELYDGTTTTKESSKDGLTIPAGPLRENINNLINYHNVFLNGNGEQTNHIKDQMKMINPNLNIIETKYISVNNKHLDKNEDYLVFSGIGNHGTFINMLKNEDYNVIEDIEFPDHYNYTKKDLQNIFSIADKKKLKILTTEKDYLRIGPINLNKIHCIESALELTKEEKLIDILKINNETN